HYSLLVTFYLLLSTYYFLLLPTTLFLSQAYLSGICRYQLRINPVVNHPCSGIFSLYQLRQFISSGPAMKVSYVHFVERLPEKRIGFRCISCYGCVCPCTELI